MGLATISFDHVDILTFFNPTPISPKQKAEARANSSPDPFLRAGESALLAPPPLPQKIEAGHAG